METVAEASRAWGSYVHGLWSAQLMMPAVWGTVVVIAADNLTHWHRPVGSRAHSTVYTFYYNFLEIILFDYVSTQVYATYRSQRSTFRRLPSYVFLNFIYVICLFA